MDRQPTDYPRDSISGGKLIDDGLAKPVENRCDGGGLVCAGFFGIVGMIIGAVGMWLAMSAGTL